MKTPIQIGQDIKQKYPGFYDQYPDEVIGQRALLKNPSLGDSSMGDVITQATKEGVATVGGYQPDTEIGNFATNPVTQAKALPALAGTGLAGLGVPMGASLGTGGGNLLADAVLKSYGKSSEIPSTRSQVLGTGIAALGDLTAIPAINRKIFGSQIGAAEDAAGVPPAQEIPSLPKPKAGEPVSGGIDSAIESVNAAKAGGGGTPTYWKQIKDQVDNFYNLGKDVKLTDLDAGKLKWLNAQVQQGLNASVPGRAAPAASLAMSQGVPNTFSGINKAVPWWVKAPVLTGATWAGGKAVGGALEKALGGGN